MTSTTGSSPDSSVPATSVGASALRRADSVGAKLPLPEGTLPVGLGVLIAGICSFAFFRVGAFALGEDAFKPVASLWFATFALAPGFFLPLEQELGRALSARRAVGEGGRPVQRRVVALGAALATMVSLTILAFGPVLRTNYFDGSWVMVVALVVAIAAYAPAHISRGTCSGTGRFDAYAIVLGGEGVMRIVFCLALALFGVKAVGAYGFAVALAPLVGVIFVLRRGQLHTDPGPEADWAEVTPNLGWLLVGSVMAACLVNAGPISVNLLAKSSDSALVTRFAYGVIVARVPLFLFQAVQAALLPRLSRLATTGEMTEFRRGFGRLMAVVLAVGVIGTMAAYTLGPFVIDKLYGAPLTRRTLTMLALGSVCYMVALAAAQAVIALHGHALVALGWTMGMVVFVVVTAALGGEVFRRVEVALLAGSAASMLAFLIALRSRLRSGAIVDQASMMDAVTDWPLEA